MPQMFMQIIENGRLAMRLMNDPRVSPLVRYGIPAFLLLYVVSPVDFIPDVFPVLGQMDDLAIVALGLGLMARFAPAHVVDEHRRALGYDVTPPSTGGTKPGTRSSAPDGSSNGANYWSTPTKPGAGQRTTRIPGNGSSIDGEYKVVGDR